MRHPVYTRDQKRVRHTRRPVTGIDRQRQELGVETRNRSREGSRHAIH